MKNQVTFNAPALLITAVFAGSVVLAYYAESNGWWVAAPIVWALHGLISGGWRRGVKGDDDSEPT